MEANPSPAVVPSAQRPALGADPLHLFRCALRAAGPPDDRLFHPDRILGWCLRHTGPIAVGPLGVLLFLDLLRAPANPFHSATALLWVDLTDWIFVSLTLALLAGGMLFHQMLRQTPGALVQLADSGRLLPRADDRRTATFSDRFRARISSRLRWRPIAFLMANAIAFSLFSGAGGAVRRTLADGVSLLGVLDAAWLLVRGWLAPLLWAYVAGGAIWVMLTIGRAIIDLTPSFDLDVQPAHPDRCGGLERLGDLCFGLALPSLLGMVVASAFAILTTVLDASPAVTTFAYVGLAILTPLSILTFILPVLDIHRDMLGKRAAYQDGLAQLVADAEDRLREVIQAEHAGPDEPQSADRLEAITERLEALKKLYPTARQYPTWPFNTGLFLRAFSPQFAPAIAVLLGLSDGGATLKEVLAYLQQVLGGQG